MDGSLWQVHVHRCCHNSFVIHLDMVASTAAGSEENYLNDNRKQKNYENKTPFYHVVSYHSSHILAFCPSYFDICKERSTFASKLKNDENRKNNPSPLA